MFHVEHPSGSRMATAERGPEGSGRIPAQRNPTGGVRRIVSASTVETKSNALPPGSRIGDPSPRRSAEARTPRKVR